MSKTKTGTNAQFTSAGRGLTVIGDHCYAYSGSILAIPLASGLGETTLLDFHTGKGYMLVRLQPCYFATGTGTDMFFTTYINEIKVYASEIDASRTYPPFDEYKIIIPPLSHFKITAYTSDADRDCGVTLTGEVYG